MLSTNLKTLAARAVAPGRHLRLREAGISTWDRVRSSMWHPMATVEQSLMDMERLTSQLLSGRAFPFSRGLLPRMHDDEDDFFKDLEVGSTKESVPKHAPPPPTSNDKNKEKQHDDVNHSFSSYSFSSSTLLDAQGHRISSIRRRYEDSTGRLKAVHEREIDGKRLRNMWRRKTADDKGEHHTVCMGSSSEEFEEQWKETPFGQAEKHHGKEQLSAEEQHLESQKPHGHASKSPELEELEQQQHPKSAFGVDYTAAEAAPEKTCGAEAQGATAEAKAKRREDAIAEGSKTQEEETTPPNYSTQGTTAEARAKRREDAIAEGSKTQEEETTPPNYSAAEAAPETCGAEATAEARAKRREDAIAEGSKTQEEETTPPNYSTQGTTAEARAKRREDAIAEGSKTQQEETTPPNYSA